MWSLLGGAMWRNRSALGDNIDQASVGIAADIFHVSANTGRGDRSGTQDPTRRWYMSSETDADRLRGASTRPQHLRRPGVLPTVARWTTSSVGL
jgi:hypothetical protein